MAGQPIVGGVTYFDVTNVEAVETAPTALQPPNIIREGQSFDIQVEFNGNSVGTGGLDPWAMIWGLMRDSGAHSYSIDVLIESIGAGFEGLLAQTAAPVTLTAGQDNYTVNLSVPGGIPAGGALPLGSGLYKVGVIVRLSGPGVAVPRYLGFTENLFVEIAPGA